MTTAGKDDVIVEPFVIDSLEPHVGDREIAKLLPKSGEHPIRSSVIIRGINSGIANGLRRILHAEMENFALAIDQDSFRSTDPFVMIDMMTRRVLQIPITQDQVEPGMHFVLDVLNDTDDPMDVFSSSLLFSHSDSKKPPSKKISAASSARPFFETFNILTLQPHSDIHFAAVIVAGNGADDAVFATAFTTMIIPLDERPQGDSSRPASDTKPRYVSSSVSDPHVYQLVFETVGKGRDPAPILARAVDSFITRTKAILAAPVSLGQEKQASGSSAQTTPTGEDTVGLYTIRIRGETYTIGVLFARCCTAIFPHIDLVTCECDDLTNELTIRVRSLSEPIDTVIRKTVDYAIKKLSAIRSFL